ncbi:MAG TPA: hypothetical protein VNO33_11775, partial [Kofleriaceae bacterium]|nr:hypothetical protein [Kofleriaceae bacterium]
MSPAAGGDLWSRFVAACVVESRQLAAALEAIGLDDLQREEARLGMHRAGYLAFSIASQSLLMGAEPVGRLALAVERLLDHVRAGEVQGELVLPYVASACHTLVQAFDELASPDRSGARVEGLPLEAARYELETLLPVPGQAPVGGPDVPIASLKGRANRPELGTAGTARPRPGRSAQG